MLCRALMLCWNASVGHSLSITSPLPGCNLMVSMARTRIRSHEDAANCNNHLSPSTNDVTLVFMSLLLIPMTALPSASWCWCCN